MNTIHHHIHLDTKLACYTDDIATPASISVKRKLDSVQHRAAKIIIGAVSSTNNEKAEQECGLLPLESKRNLATIKFTNKLRSYDLDHISRIVFDRWKHSFYKAQKIFDSPTS
ncbi:hypothetical protein TNCV_2471861 [Trichonephila clavipes]|nr:hypothetical protein TNCV_2471861 [Trichonephila clavipes]